MQITITLMEKRKNTVVAEKKEAHYSMPGKGRGAIPEKVLDDRKESFADK